MQNFFSKKKFAALPLQDLQEIDTALEFASKILFYTALLIPLLVLIYTLLNYYDDAETLRHLGPNCAVLILSILYLSLLEMIIITMKAKVRKSVILYMAEDTPITSEKESPKSLLKTILGIACFAAVCVLYGYASGVYAWGKYSLLDSLFDIPFILIMAVYTLPLIAISGNLKILFASLKLVFVGKNIRVAQQNLYRNVLKSTIHLNWYAAFSGAACGWIGILNNLEDVSYLPANLATSLIPFFYATCLNLFLLLAEIRVAGRASSFMIFDFAIVAVLTAILTLLTSNRKEIILHLRQNSVTAGLLLTVFLLIIFIRRLNYAEYAPPDFYALLISILVKFRPLLISILFELVFSVAERVLKKNTESGEEKRKKVPRARNQLRLIFRFFRAGKSKSHGSPQKATPTPRLPKAFLSARKR